MSKRQFKSHASSGRAGAAFGAFGSAGFGKSQSSVLSYVQEPSDYSSISDSNVVVAFKNLSKKDATTKAKALEDLQVYVTSSEVDVEEAFIEAWAKLFPRLSIDNSRRVRQLTHILNGHVCARSGKRTARHMPRISGPWLAGTFDNDRTVARAALDALNLVFPTPEKIQGVRKAFQRSILEYCRDAALHETVKTLNDERVVSSDDAEATFARVVATSLSLVSSFLAELDADVVQKELNLYEEVFSEPKLWEFVHHADPGVRRAMYRLVRACLDKRPNLIQDNIKLVSSAFIYKGLHSDQAGSALDFIRTLESLTSSFSTIWTDAYEGKKPAISRLRHFLKQGSQSSAAEFWESLSNLFKILPKQLLPTKPEDVGDLLSSTRAGVSRREERLNASTAWPAYFTLADVVTSGLEDGEAQIVLDTHVMPVVRQYLDPSPETADWSITSPRAAMIVSRVTIAGGITPLIIRDWPSFSERLTEMAKLSQPEQAKDFDKSQKDVAAAGERWATVQGELWTVAPDDKLTETFSTASTTVLDVCIGVLNSRNGKPYGAAAIIEQLLRACANRLMQDENFRNAYFTFVENDMANVVSNGSQRHLVRSLYATTPEPMFSNAFKTFLARVIDAQHSNEAKLNALRTIFTLEMPEKAIEVARGMPEFQDFLSQVLSTARDKGVNDLFSSLVELGALSTKTEETVLVDLMTTLTTSGEAEFILSTIDAFTKTDQDVVQKFVSKPGGAGEQLLPRLLKLEQSPNDEIAEKATYLSSKLSSTVAGTASDAKYAMILQNLEQTSESSLPIDAVRELANRLLGPETSIERAADVLPSIDVWLHALQAAVRPPKLSMSLMSPLGGSVYLLHDEVDRGRSGKFDAEGLSQAFRISSYVARLFATTDLLQRLGDIRPTVLALLHISVLVAEDNVSVLGSNDFWSVQSGSEGELAGLEFISEARQILNDCWKAAGPYLTSDASEKFSQIRQNVKTLRGDRNPSSPMSYYVSLSYVETITNLFELHGFSAAQVKENEATLKERRSAKQTLPLVEFVAAFRQPLTGTQSVNRVCNELVAELTDLNASDHEQKVLEQLVVLNIVLRTQEHVADGIAKQRLIFFVKRIISWLDADTLPVVRVEVCKALAELLPYMHDIYGEHWEQVLSFLVTTWNSTRTDRITPAPADSDILLMSVSLKLLAVLQRCSKYEEPNDDLLDTLKEKDEQLWDALINLLISSEGISDDTNQPLMVTHELLSRQLASLPRRPLKSPDELYPLIYTPSRPLVQAAFDLLHKYIPSAQEQISFDAALDNKTAHLPDELLSLVLEAPTLDSLADVHFDRMMPLSLQSYLFSWRLLFDHFDGSSYRVKNDYVEQLKDGAYLESLLDLTFDFLGHTRGKPVNVAKLDLVDYVPDSEPDPEKDVQWLLAHLYFLALTHLPSLVKTYYFSIRSRQTSSTIETWTAKYISPLIIDAALRGVAEWSEKSVKEDPEFEKMTVKVGLRSKEINVSYIVDEQTMAIKVVLPEAYPLASAQVLGVSRVAVKEEKWQSWLRNCQGVITFSNGSIIDGLTAWRKNVTGALKGQTECAICYSIISADKQLPTKRCPTCKNLFHASCLLKWFKTSNASTCPLCRNPFNFN